MLNHDLFYCPDMDLYLLPVVVARESRWAQASACYGINDRVAVCQRNLYGALKIFHVQNTDHLDLVERNLSAAQSQLIEKTGGSVCESNAPATGEPAARRF